LVLTPTRWLLRMRRPASSSRAIQLVVFRVGAVAEDFVDGCAAAAGSGDWPCAGADASLGCGGAAAAGAAGLEAGLAIAFTALRHGTDKAHCA